MSKDIKNIIGCLKRSEHSRSYLHIMRYTKIITFILLLNAAFCIKEKNPIDSTLKNKGNGNLLVKTDKNIYSWHEGESYRIIIIQGTLENRSDITFYSEIGDGFGPPEQDQLFIAENSQGYIEKYNESDTSWYEKNLAGLLIEGARMVPLKPSKVYSIYAHLSIEKDSVENGKYRIRIDYYHSEEAKNDMMPFKDYSNTFEIK